MPTVDTKHIILIALRRQEGKQECRDYTGGSTTDYLLKPGLPRVKKLRIILAVSWFSRTNSRKIRRYFVEP
jgi:hypothetical protein